LIREVTLQQYKDIYTVVFEDHDPTHLERLRVSITYPDLKIYEGTVSYDHKKRCYAITGNGTLTLPNQDIFTGTF
jgi:hypothetical protein